MIMEEKLPSQNDSNVSSSKLILKQKQAILPLLEKQSLKILKNKRIQNLNFNVMLNLPIIVKEKGIFERKNTLKVFNRRKMEVSIVGLRNNTQKDNSLKSGKIYINELWSNKYQQSILKDSKIQEQIDQIKGLVRKNVDELVDDVHEAIQNKYGDLKQLIFSNKYLQQRDNYRIRRNGQSIQIFLKTDN